MIKLKNLINQHLMKVIFNQIKIMMCFSFHKQETGIANNLFVWIIGLYRVMAIFDAIYQYFIYIFLDFISLSVTSIIIHVYRFSHHEKCHIKIFEFFNLRICLWNIYFETVLSALFDIVRIILFKFTHTCTSINPN